MSVETITGAAVTTSTRSSATRVTSTSVSTSALAPLIVTSAVKGRSTDWPTARPAKRAGSSLAVTVAAGLSATPKNTSRIRSSRISTPVLTEARSMLRLAVPSAATLPESASKRLFSATSPALIET